MKKTILLKKKKQYYFKNKLKQQHEEYGVFSSHVTCYCEFRAHEINFLSFNGHVLYYVF